MAVKSTFANMALCLGSITLVCSLLLGGVYVITAEPIADAAHGKTQKAIAAVSPFFESVTEGVAQNGSTFYTTYDSEGNVAAYVVNASSTGFGGVLNIMVGFRPDGTIYDTAVLSHSETPGLGAKCTDPAFKDQFRDFNPAVKTLQVKKDGGDVDAITASTITSRAVCKAVENAVATFNTLAAAQAANPTVEPENEGGCCNE